MLYLFRIISDEDQDFYRDLLIDSSDTFLNFHNVLQENLNYDASQLASFFITNEAWEKTNEITLIDMQIDSLIPIETMEQTMIGDYTVDKNQRMLYVFDFFSERAFFIELMETFDKKSQVPTPFISAENGAPPTQLAFSLEDNDFTGALGDSDDEDSDDIDFIPLNGDYPDPDNPDAY